MGYNLKYRTFDSLLASAMDDLSGYDLDSAFNVGAMIKEVLRINKELGFKLNKEYEVMLEIKENKASLPSNFYKANFAYICSSYTHKAYAESLASENVEIHDCEWAENMQAFKEDCAVEYTCCVPYKVVKHGEVQEYNINKVIPVNLNNGEFSRHKTPYDLMFKSGYVVSSFNTGKVMLNYIGSMEDEDGNLLVLDHDIINSYYEYALKAKIFESLYLNGDDSVINRLQLVKQELRDARRIANSIVNTPEISEIAAAVQYNRRRAVNKYFNPIQNS